MTGIFSLYHTRANMRGNWRHTLQLHLELIELPLQMAPLRSIDCHSATCDKLTRWVSADDTDLSKFTAFHQGPNLVSLYRSLLPRTHIFIHLVGLISKWCIETKCSPIFEMETGFFHFFNIKISTAAFKGLWEAYNCLILGSSPKLGGIDPFRRLCERSLCQVGPPSVCIPKWKKTNA